jgi:uncharacterized protein
MASVDCPKCKYKHAEKEKSYKKYGMMGPWTIKTSWSCPKCDFEKETETEISKSQYKEGIESDSTSVGSSRPIAIQQVSRGGCCVVGLVPAMLLFLPFMTVYPSRRVLLSIIAFHKKRSSPVLNTLHFKCRFDATCSEYSRLAIQRDGTFKGGLKTFWRILRCNPFNRIRKMSALGGLA